tara:strand:+ start:3835 stop:5763 length:1929 start_codon:yes stop_codon:yes gene_type:complete
MMNFKNELIKNKIAAMLILVAFIIGFLIPSGESKETLASHEKSTEATAWACAMHPNVNLPEPGQCPICFMDLIPLEGNISGLNQNQLSLSESAMKLADIQTVTVGYGIAEMDVQLSGKVEYDESRISNITAWVPGRLERMFVDYTGIRVEKGDHMMELYSPELYAAKEELIQSRKLFKSAESKTGFGKQTLQATLSATREKLRLMGLMENQIKEIEQKSSPSNMTTLYSPMSGIVIEKNGVEGAYVKTGTNIYTIADLTRVWVVLDAYESDLPWLAFGQKASFTTEGIPGKTFEGQVAFIDPIVDSQTRTVNVRLNVMNTKGELKPGMFVHGTVHATIGHGGKAINPELAEKWVCPMHPEIVEEKPGRCAVCEMPLVTSESLGIVHAPDHHYESLLIPASAVLRTGSRAIVYVRLPNPDPTFEGREIILGPRVGDHYIVKSGLEAGEKVVVNGNFKIDSAMQIAAKQSMMNPRINKYKVSKKDKLKVTDEVMEFMEKVLVHYYAIQQSLAGDNLSDTQSSVKGLNQLLQSFQNGHVQLVHEAAFQWKKVYTQMQETTTHHQHWNSIDEVRMAFKNLSQAFLNYENLFGHFSESTAYEVFCPLAFDNSGASWLSQKNEVLNPYFGASMLKCGEVKREFQVTGN